MWNCKEPSTTALEHQLRFDNKILHNVHVLELDEIGLELADAQANARKDDEGNYQY